MLRRFSEILRETSGYLPTIKWEIDSSHEIHLANQILAMNKKLAEAKTPQAKNMLQRQIEATDKQIDQMVYKLYDLTCE